MRTYGDLKILIDMCKLKSAWISTFFLGMYIYPLSVGCTYVSAKTQPTISHLLIEYACFWENLTVDFIHDF